MSTKFYFSLDHAVTKDALLSGTNQLSRADWVVNLLRDDFYFLQDGEFSRLLLNEVLECFIGGQFIASIILGFSMIERSVAGRLSYIGEKSTAKGNSAQLIEAALKRSWITQAEYDHIDKLRTLRNPIAHFKEFMEESRPEVRASLDGKSTAQLLETDAKKTLEAMIHILEKTAL